MYIDAIGFFEVAEFVLIKVIVLLGLLEIIIISIRRLR